MIPRILLTLGIAVVCTHTAVSADNDTGLTASNDPVANTSGNSGPPPDVTRSAALELAGAFANDGYKVRDGYLTQLLTKESPILLEVNLFNGNEYWFSAAAAPQAPQKIDVTVFDSQGKIVDQQKFDEGFRYAAGFEPTASGQYFVKVSLSEGDSTPVTLVYSYK
jgi:hypothetical protein